VTDWLLEAVTVGANLVVVKEAVLGVTVTPDAGSVYVTNTSIGPASALFVPQVAAAPSTKVSEALAACPAVASRLHV